MIVCKQCGYHNEEGDTFCGSCGTFLEWVGEKVGTEEPEPEPVEEEVEDKKGLFTRIKEKITDVAEGDAETGVTEHPDADRALTPEELAPEKPLVTAATAATLAAPEATAGSSSSTTTGPLPPPPGGGGGLTPPPAGGSGTLPPPVDTPEAAAARDKAKAEAEAKAKKEAEEQAKKEAEEAAKRKEEEARRRAALLVAKPKEVEPDTKAVIATTPQKDAGKKKKGKEAVGSGDTVTIEADTISGIEARSPGEQKPGQQNKTKVKPKEPPSRAIKPGDLVCGSCGEGNDPARKFCRRCGVSLVEAEVAKKPGFFKRLFTRKPKDPVAAGTRPGRGGGGKGGKAGEKARLGKGKILGVFTSVSQLLTVLALLGVGVAFAEPNLRSGTTNFFNSGIRKVRNFVSPSYTPVSVDPNLTIASTFVPGAEAFKASDGIRNNHWAPLPEDGAPALELTFAVPTNLDVLFVHSGNQDEEKNFAANPRPQSLFVTLFDNTGEEVGSKQINLQDKADAQKFDLKGTGVKRVRVDVQSCFPDPAVKSCALAELEFQKKKT